MRRIKAGYTLRHMYCPKSNEKPCKIARTGLFIKEHWLKAFQQSCNSYKYVSTRILHRRRTYTYSRAGEFTKKNLYHGKNRVFGPKNAPKKFGSPTPNFPPPQFGKQGSAQFIKVGTPRWGHRTLRIWIYVKIIYNFQIFSLFTPSLFSKFLTLLSKLTLKNEVSS